MNSLSVTSVSGTRRNKALARAAEQEIGHEGQELAPLAQEPAP